MVWPITGAESYVCEMGKSMKAVESAVIPKGLLESITNHATPYYLEKQLQFLPLVAPTR
jgi:hypothetical protein